MITSISNKKDPSIAGVTFDCVFSESVEAGYESTDYTVEDGSIYADHIRKLPKIITMRVGVSDTPFKDILGSVKSTGIGYAGSKLPPLITSAAGIAFDAYDSLNKYNASNSASKPDTKSATAWQQMLDAADKRNILFDIITTKNIYQNYFIRRMYYETNPDNDGSIEILIEMKEIRTFKSNLETGQPSKSQLKAGTSESIQAAPKSNLGGLALEQI